MAEATAKPKKSFGEIFWKKNPLDTPNVEEERPKTSPLSQVSNFAQSYTSQPQPQTAGFVNQDLIKEFEEVLFQNNMPGIDYYEFRKALTDLEKIIPDEASRYKAAFITLQSQGLTVDKMLSDINDHYIPVMDEEQKKFNEGVEHMLAETVTANEDKIKSMESDNEAMRTQIQELSTKIQTNLNTIASLNGETAGNRSKIENNKASFIASFESFKNKILDDCRKIKMYLS